MELDDLKQAWAALDHRLARQETLRLHLFRSDRLEKMRRGLRPLFWGQLVQILFGAAIIALGASLWNSRHETATLLVTGLIVHAFGIVTVAAAGLVLAQMSRIDYAAPVLAIQHRFVALRRTHALSGAVTGLPWWVMWVFVTVAIPGLGGIDLYAVMPVFVWSSLAVGVVGWLVTWAYMRRQAQRSDSEARDLAAACGSLRKAQAILDEVARFEQD